MIDVRLKNAYIELINRVTCESRRLYNAQIPILIHGYAHPIPDGQGVRVLGDVISGPWLEPAFKKKGYNDLAYNTMIMRTVIDRFNDMLSELAEDFEDIPVKHVDVRRCLNNSLWDNELHPTSEGFEKIAAEFDAQIKQLPNPRVR